MLVRGAGRPLKITTTGHPSGANQSKAVRPYLDGNQTRDDPIADWNRSELDAR
jgi:hypothetical protein